MNFPLEFWALLPALALGAITLFLGSLYVALVAMRRRPRTLSELCADTWCEFVEFREAVAGRREDAHARHALVSAATAWRRTKSVRFTAVKNIPNPDRDHSSVSAHMEAR